jgi:hypothetical protein
MPIPKIKFIMIPILLIFLRRAFFPVGVLVVIILLNLIMHIRHLFNAPMFHYPFLAQMISLPFMRFLQFDWIKLLFLFPTINNFN